MSEIRSFEDLIVWQTETLDWYLKCRDLGLIDGGTFRQRSAMLEEILKMLNRMISQQLAKRDR